MDVEREEPKVKVDTLIKLCTEGIEMLSQGKVHETIMGLTHTLDMARQMLAVHQGRGDVLIKSKVQLGQIPPGTKGKLIKNDEFGMLVEWEIADTPRPLVDLFFRHNFEEYIDLEGKCDSHRN
ncbi:hypothetical protein [Desulforamulus aquiferis]|nr:hypothetical protein [Desulforamulus aquiferis]